MSQPLLSLRQVATNYPDRNILAEADFELNRGERVALLGPNGAGKTTLLHLLVGLHPIDAGIFTAFGKRRKSEADFREVRARVGLLFQDSDDQLFCPTVLEDVAFGPLNLEHSRPEALAIARETLSDLGLAGFADRITHKLSGGEKRLVSLATVLAMRPEVLLLDEPTIGLDEETEQRLIDYLEQLPQAMVFVSHDQAFVERLATRAVLIRERTLVESLLHRHPHVHAHSHLHIHPLDQESRHEHESDIRKHEEHTH